jgi:hypothetical protein
LVVWKTLWWCVEPFGGVEDSLVVCRTLWWGVKPSGGVYWITLCWYMKAYAGSIVPAGAGSRTPWGIVNGILKPSARFGWVSGPVMVTEFQLAKGFSLKKFFEE